MFTEMCHIASSLLCFGVLAKQRFGVLAKQRTDLTLVKMSELFIPVYQVPLDFFYF